MRIIVTGGTGFIGHALVRTLGQDGHAVTVLTRRAGPAKKILGLARVVEWNPTVSGSWEQEFSGIDAVVNLAGEPIANGRWTESRKRSITQSRIDTTNAIVEALRGHSTGPCTLINASGIGYYGTSNGISIYETVGAGDGFLADLCVKWEREARRAEDFRVRVVRLRFGMVSNTMEVRSPRWFCHFGCFSVDRSCRVPNGSHGSIVRTSSAWSNGHSAIRTWTGAVNAVSPDPVTMRTFCGRWTGVEQAIVVAGAAIYLACRAGRVGNRDDNRPAGVAAGRVAGRIYISLSDVGTGAPGGVFRFRFEKNGCSACYVSRDVHLGHAFVKIGMCEKKRAWLHR